MRWGTDRSKFDGYAVADAEVVLRVLLPLERAEDRAAVRWADVAVDLDSPLTVGGYVSWYELSEFPGTGARPTPRIYLPPCGRVPDSTLALLKAALRAALGDTTWLSAPPVEATAVASRLDSHGLGETIAPSDSPKELRGSLDQISRGWTRHGFPERAWTADQTAGIAAPGYADSLVISGPKTLAGPLLSADLEVFVVDRHHSSPITFE
jgi:hypothetical protein